VRQYYPVFWFGLGVGTVMMLFLAFELGRITAPTSPPATATRSGTFPTLTSVPTESPTATSTATATPTDVPTSTPSPTATEVPTATPIPGLACDEATQKVQDRHQTLFTLMSIADAPFGLSCGSRDPFGSIAVIVSWTSNRSQRHGTYLVSASGDVTPADSLARRIDAAATMGPFALRYLNAGN